MTETINSFSGRHRFLSNFWIVPIEFEGINYPSTEHAFQAAKTLNVEERKPVLTMTAGQAKRHGRSVTLRADWERVKIDVMRSLLRQKFDPEKHPELAAQLVATRPVMLEEGNHWGDRFWGVCEGVGENHLGKLLMEIRSELASKIAP